MSWRSYWWGASVWLWGGPWLKRLMYLKWGVHTWDIEAMTLNNLGNTFVENGEPEQAVRWYAVLDRPLKAEAHLLLDSRNGGTVTIFEKSYSKPLVASC